VWTLLFGTSSAGGEHFTGHIARLLVEDTSLKSLTEPQRFELIHPIKYCEGAL
jgi:hypothetical protein